MPRLDSDRNTLPCVPCSFVQNRFLTCLLKNCPIIWSSGKHSRRAKQPDDLSTRVTVKITAAVAVWNKLKNRFWCCLVCISVTRGCGVALMSSVGRGSAAGSGLLARGNQRSSLRNVRRQLGGADRRVQVRCGSGSQPGTTGSRAGQLETSATLKLLPWKISFSCGDSAHPKAPRSPRLTSLTAMFSPNVDGCRKLGRHFMKASSALPPKAGSLLTRQVTE